VSLKIWFILSEGQVTGPFSFEEVQSESTGKKEPLIWGKGQSEWLSPVKWRELLKDAPEAPALRHDPDSLWYVRISKEESKPQRYNDLISYLKGLNDLSEVEISTNQGKDWKEIYAYQNLVDDLGVSRRSHPRVPIVGTLTCEGPRGDFTARVISISEGGLGINDAKNLDIGDRFPAVLNSQNLYSTIHCTCEVVYVGTDGYAGIKFVNLADEFKSSIIEYVKKFAM